MVNNEALFLLVVLTITGIGYMLTELWLNLRDIRIKLDLIKKTDIPMKFGFISGLSYMCALMFMWTSLLSALKLIQYILKMIF